MTQSESKESSLENDRQKGGEYKQYLRFVAMILTSMFVMYGVTYVNTYSVNHVMWSETRLFMSLLMGATMAIVMLLFMLSMYKNKILNTTIIIGALIIFAAATALVRGQNTVQDSSYMSAMIPHHSIAILTSENADISDVRVCSLAVDIIEAQQREIEEMKWLINDIDQNGPAKTADAAMQRSAPEFKGDSIRTCAATF